MSRRLPNSARVACAFLAVGTLVISCTKQSSGTTVSNPLIPSFASDNIPDEDKLKAVLSDHFNSMTWVDMTGPQLPCTLMFTIGPPVIADHKPLTSDGMDMEVDVDMTLKVTNQQVYQGYPAESCTAEYPIGTWMPGQTVTSKWMVHMDRWSNGWRWGHVL